MRLSVVEADPGYTPYAAYVKVFLDGKECRGAVTADEEGGYVEAYVFDQLGRLVIGEGGEAAMQVLRGAVRIETPPGFAAWHPTQDAKAGA